MIYKSTNYSLNNNLYKNNKILVSKFYIICIYFYILYKSNIRAEGSI